MKKKKKKSTRTRKRTMALKQQGPGGLLGMVAEEAKRCGYWSACRSGETNGTGS